MNIEIKEAKNGFIVSPERRYDTNQVTLLADVLLFTSALDLARYILKIGKAIEKRKENQLPAK